MFTVPKCPVVADWTALKDDSEEEDNAKYAGHNKGTVQYTVHRGTNENPQVEEEDGDLKHRDVCEVHDLHDVEELHKVGDRIIIKSPYIPTEAVGDKTLCVHDCTRDGCEEGDDDEPVIQPELGFGDEYLEIQPGEEEDAADHTESDVDSVV